MKKRQYNKIGLIACVATLFMATQVLANLAAATGMLADIAVAATQANATLAAAANSGDLDAVAEAQELVAKVQSSMEEALEAYAALEGGDDAATGKLATARQNALAAVGGVPEATPKGNQEYSLPNIHDVPWQSDGLRSLYQELFNIAMSASAQGGAGNVDHDATGI